MGQVFKLIKFTRFYCNCNCNAKVVHEYTCASHSVCCSAASNDLIHSVAAYASEPPKIELVSVKCAT